MNDIQAWHEIFRLSYGNKWQSIPQKLAQQIGLDSRLGICGGIICTHVSAKGASDFINRLNRIAERKIES
jgi:hypothetical protein